MTNKNEEIMKKNNIISLKMFFMLFLIVFIIAGCFSRSKPAYMIEYYMFDYASPVAANLNTLSQTLKVERFSVNQSFNTQSMVYKPYPFKFMTYNHNRWRVNPADMVTDYLHRDLRNADVFRAVISYNDTEGARFVIEGGIKEFLEETDRDGSRAILSVYISLLDMDRKEITGRIVFQRQYRFQEQIKEHAPEEFARGMSINMSRLSEQLLNDIHKAITAVTYPMNSGQSYDKSDFPTQQGS